MQQYHTLQQTHTIEPPPSPPLLLIQHLLFIPPSYSLSYIFYSLIPPTPHPTSSILPSFELFIQHPLSIPPSTSHTTPSIYTSFYSSSNTFYPFLLLLFIQHLLSISPSTSHTTPSVHPSLLLILLIQCLLSNPPSNQIKQVPEKD